MCGTQADQRHSVSKQYYLIRLGIGFVHLGWLSTFRAIACFSCVGLSLGPILKDLSQQLCHIDRHYCERSWWTISSQQIHPDVITGTNLPSSELRCQEPSEAKRCSGVLSHESQDPIANNVSVEAQPLVFEEYMDNGQGIKCICIPEAVKLYDTRTKEWEGLKGCIQASVNRDNRQDNQDNQDSTGKSAEDADGLTRELFSQGWKSILPLFFEGTNFHVPRVDPDCSEELFEILGRIASHGFVFTGFFPLGIAPASIIAIFDSDSLSEADLIYSFPFLFNGGRTGYSRKKPCKETKSVWTTYYLTCSPVIMFTRSPLTQQDPFFVCPPSRIRNKAKCVDGGLQERTRQGTSSCL
ncbi:hypothetical protein OS493_020079 [Desmophyllum pertusum]|uniref:Uncharacterized protein n=1 Tax=Desmophyllum pertusum TaxID=174260 RepID=A0A9W9YBJ8_9CNID|nr:hypothetical protein OS493_020079 [Desmophyllum pertusum]